MYFSIVRYHNSTLCSFYAISCSYCWPITDHRYPIATLDDRSCDSSLLRLPTTNNHFNIRLPLFQTQPLCPLKLWWSNLVQPAQWPSFSQFAEWPPIYWMTLLPPGCWITTLPLCWMNPQYVEWPPSPNMLNEPTVCWMTTISHYAEWTHSMLNDHHLPISEWTTSLLCAPPFFPGNWMTPSLLNDLLPQYA